MALTVPQNQILAGDATDLCNAARREHQNLYFQLCPLLHFLLHVCFLEAEEGKPCPLSLARYTCGCGAVCMVWTDFPQETKILGKEMRERCQ